MNEFLAFVIPPSPPTPLHPRRGGKGGQQPYLGVSFYGRRTRPWAGGRAKGCDAIFYKKLPFSAEDSSGKRSHFLINTDGCNPPQHIGLKAQRAEEPKAQRRPTGSSPLKTRGQIGLLAPLSAPTGVERGWGIGGGLKRQNAQHHPNKPPMNPLINWSLTPISCKLIGI